MHPIPLRFEAQGPIPPLILGPPLSRTPGAIHHDLGMYGAHHDRPAVAWSTDLNEELGQVRPGRPVAPGG